MEKDQLRSNALENELELGAVAEAQVAQAEGLLQVVEAIGQHQRSFKTVAIVATLFGTIIGAGAICSFMWLYTQEIREAAHLSMPIIEHETRLEVLENIDWTIPPSPENSALYNSLVPEKKLAFDRMIEAMKTDPDGWLHFIEHGGGD